VCCSDLQSVQSSEAVGVGVAEAQGQFDHPEEGKTSAIKRLEAATKQQ
jgi:hypothetical protein